MADPQIASPALRELGSVIRSTDHHRRSMVAISIPIVLNSQHAAFHAGLVSLIFNANQGHDNERQATQSEE